MDPLDCCSGSDYSSTAAKNFRAAGRKVTMIDCRAGGRFGAAESGVEQVPAERIVPDAKENISEIIDDPETIYDPEIWDTPGLALVLSWLAQKWQRKCRMLAPRGYKNPEQYLTKEQQKACLDSAAAELIREIKQQRPLN
jgi:hypothetical protein